MDAHGNHVELQAISEIFLRPIEIYEYSSSKLFIFKILKNKDCEFCESVFNVIFCYIIIVQK